MNSPSTDYRDQYRASNDSSIPPAPSGSLLETTNVLFDVRRAALAVLLGHADDSHIDMLLNNGYPVLKVDHQDIPSCQLSAREHIIKSLLHILCFNDFNSHPDISIVDLHAHIRPLFMQLLTNFRETFNVVRPEHEQEHGHPILASGRAQAFYNVVREIESAIGKSKRATPLFVGGGSGDVNRYVSGRNTLKCLIDVLDNYEEQFCPTFLSPVTCHADEARRVNLLQNCLPERFTGVGMIVHKFLAIEVHPFLLRDFKVTYEHDVRFTYVFCHSLYYMTADDLRTIQHQAVVYVITHHFQTQKSDGLFPTRTDPEFYWLRTIRNNRPWITMSPLLPDGTAYEHPDIGLIDYMEIDSNYTCVFRTSERLGKSFALVLGRGRYIQTSRGPTATFVHKGQVVIATPEMGLCQSGSESIKFVCLPKADPFAIRSKIPITELHPDVRKKIEALRLRLIVPNSPATYPAYTPIVPKERKVTAPPPVQVMTFEKVESTSPFPESVVDIVVDEEESAVKLAVQPGKTLFSESGVGFGAVVCVKPEDVPIKPKEMIHWTEAPDSHNAKVAVEALAKMPGLILQDAKSCLATVKTVAVDSFRPEQPKYTTEQKGKSTVTFQPTSSNEATKVITKADFLPDDCEMDPVSMTVHTIKPPHTTFKPPHTTSIGAIVKQPIVDAITKANSNCTPLTKYDNKNTPLDDDNDEEYQLYHPSSVRRGWKPYDQRSIKSDQSLGRINDEDVYNARIEKEDSLFANGMKGVHNKMYLSVPPLNIFGDNQTVQFNPWPVMSAAAVAGVMGYKLNHIDSTFVRTMRAITFGTAASVGTVIVWKIGATILNYTAYWMRRAMIYRRYHKFTKTRADAEEENKLSLTPKEFAERKVQYQLAITGVASKQSSKVIADGIMRTSSNYSIPYDEVLEDVVERMRARSESQTQVAKITAELHHKNFAVRMQEGLMESRNPVAALFVCALKYPFTAFTGIVTSCVAVSLAVRYATPVFMDNRSNEIEQIQKAVARFVFPNGGV